MTDKQSDALQLADFMTSKYDLYEFSEQMQVATLLRTQHAELQQWKNVFGHLGTADECGNEWIRLQDAIERKDALLRKAWRQMSKLSADDVCEALHHKKEDRHGLLAPCPVAGRFMAVREAITKELQ